MDRRKANAGKGAEPMIKCASCGHANPDGITFCAKCGIDLVLIPPSTTAAEPDEQVRALLAEGKKIEAIKQYREQTGVGLAEAKAAVESLARGESLAARTLDPALEDKIVLLLQKGAVIPAVKAYRTAHNCQLKEAKDAIDAIGERHGIKATKGLGCVVAVALAVLGAAGLAALLSLNR
jgi:ribosomal protein L7/L12